MLEDNIEENDDIEIISEDNENDGPIGELSPQNTEKIKPEQKETNSEEIVSEPIKSNLQKIKEIFQSDDSIIDKITVFALEYKTYLIISGVILVIILAVIIPHPQKPLTKHGMLKKAEAYEEKGQVAFALEEYKRIATLYPKNYDIHIKLAELYKQVRSIDNSKIEYLQAIALRHQHRYEADVALAEIYCEQVRYDLAEEVIYHLKNTKSKPIRAALGHLYSKMAKNLEAGDRLEAIRKYKIAREYYKNNKGEKEKEVLNDIGRVYADIADSLLENNELEKAIDIIKLSIDYHDNAFAHYKLAKMFEGPNPEIALNEYEKAFKLDSDIASKTAYAKLLIERSKFWEKQGNKVKSQLYYLKARKLDSSIDVQKNPDNTVLFNLIASKVNEDVIGDELTPGIIFNINNIGKEMVKYLKMKVIFFNHGKPISTRNLTLANEIYPIEGDSKTKNISIYSNRQVKHIYDEHDLSVHVYISRETPDNWKLFRKIEILREKKDVTLSKKGSH